MNYDELIKDFINLINLRDEKCSDSKNYKFKPLTKNYFIYRNEEGKYFTDFHFYNESLYTVYFASFEDAQKICDILNSGKFNLKGEENEN